MTNKLNIRGWEHLAGDRPDVVALREKVLRHLTAVPQPHRANWEKRIRSKLNQQHFSARLEIFLHHFLKERHWKIEIEPYMPGTRNRPDFLISIDGVDIIVEAKTMLDPTYVDQQDTRLMELADRLGGKLNCTVSVHPRIDLPSSLPNKRIASEIERKASGAEPFHEFSVEGVHQGCHYALDVAVMIGAKPSPTAGVGGTVSQVYEVGVGHQMRNAIRGKASKYGKFDVPYIIAVWPQTYLHFSYRSDDEDDDDFEALFGDKVIRGRNTADMKCVIKPNGLFTMGNKHDGPRYGQVSAVAVCYPDENSFTLYHNPYANVPVDKSVFDGVPQKLVDATTGKHWWA